MEKVGNVEVLAAEVARLKCELEAYKSLSKVYYDSLH